MYWSKIDQKFSRKDYYTKRDTSTRLKLSHFLAHK